MNCMPGVWHNAPVSSCLKEGEDEHTTIFIESCLSSLRDRSDDTRVRKQRKVKNVSVWLAC
jgi:hypothetical protein